MAMSSLKGKRVVVTGGSRGLGRAIVHALDRAGAQVVAIARGDAALGQLRSDTEQRVETRTGDVADPVFAEQVLREVKPDILVLNAGAQPHLAPVREHTWESFSAAWDTDVRATFHWSKLALTLPLAPGSTVLISSSGAAVGGSPLSGGYAGAKRMQWILADYLQRESKALNLGTRFQALLPRGIVAETEIGGAAATAYAKATGLTQEQYMARFGLVVTAARFGQGVLEILTAPPTDAVACVITGSGVHPVGLSLAQSELAAMT
jgi:NAD(P)-dependent dehydrogenase (short-subunit alcohol dehydrogenase family)